MKFISFAICLLFFCYDVRACPPVDLPEYASMNCSWISSGVKQCRFDCEGSASMIGQSVITCQKESNEWDSLFPVCSPQCELNKKGKIVCPKISKELIKKAAAHSGSLTSEQRHAIRQIKNAYRSRKIRRSSKKCYTWMCNIDCIYLAPSQHLVNRCKRCSVKVLDCKNRSGSLFG